MSQFAFTTAAIEHLLAREDMSPAVRERLEWFLHYARFGSVSSTCRQFTIARTTFYRWATRFDPADLSTLENLPTVFVDGADVQLHCIETGPATFNTHPVTSQFAFTTAAIEHLLARGDMSPSVRERLEWFLHYARFSSVSSTCRQFAIARTTFYRWATRFDSNDLSTLENLPTAFVDSAQSEPAPAALVLAVPSVPEARIPALHPADCYCLPCKAKRRNWRPLRRTFFIASVLINFVFFASLITTALLEQTSTTPALTGADQVRASLTDLSQP